MWNLAGSLAPAKGVPWLECKTPVVAGSPCVSLLNRDLEGEVRTSQGYGGGTVR